MVPASALSGDIRRGSILPASVRSGPGPLARLPSSVCLPVRLMQAGRVRLPLQAEQAGRVRLPLQAEQAGRLLARPFPKATAIFPPPTPGRKFPAIFPARGFMRAV